MPEQTHGIVYLVGAGPGDPELITVRGLRLIREAEVVVYDRLASPALLEEVKVGAELIYVGKTAGHHVRKQEEINDILVEKAREGRMVVRLKGGDPFVFGRGGEEGLALAQAGVPFEVVPGVTSAVSVPAYAGIPVTHRGVANAFTVITGHACASEPLDLDWEALTRVGTLVVLMGGTQLGNIAQRLMEAGSPGETPLAVISAGSTARQAVVTGTLGCATELAGAAVSPVTIVIGEVVRLREQLAWFTAAPELSAAA